LVVDIPMGVQARYAPQIGAPTFTYSTDEGRTWSGPVTAEQFADREGLTIRFEREGDPA
jgi:hypothetical protein